MTQTQFKCADCDAVFYTREDLEQHNRTIHSRFTCDLCGESFGSESEFEAHTRVMHPEIQKSGNS